MARADDDSPRWKHGHSERVNLQPNCECAIHWEVLPLRNSISKAFAAKVMATAVVAGAGLCGTGHNANATPSTLGFYPSTDIYAKSNWHLDVDTYGQAFRTNSSVSDGISVGIGPDTSKALGRTEIGLDYLINSGVTPSGKRLLFNAKTQLFDDDKKGTRFVVGTWGVGAKQIGAPDVVYALASKTFTFGRIHLGLAEALASKATVADGNGTGDRTNVALGYDRAINPKWSVAVDWYSGKNTYSGAQPTIYYNVNPQADFGLGLFHLNSSAVGARNQVYACFDYNFGKGAPK